MNPETISRLLLEYRYWILIPLSIIEGPVVAFVSGTLASLGYFNVYGLALFFFARDMIMDAFYYCFGLWGGRTAFAKKMLRRMEVTEEHLDDVRRLWEKRPFRTMLIGKVSYGIASAFIVVAGMVRMSLFAFFKYGALAAIAQYGTLLILGYFFGNAFGGSLPRFIANIQYVLGGAALLLSLYYAASWYLRRRFIAEEKKAEGEELKRPEP